MLKQYQYSILVTVGLALLLVGFFTAASPIFSTIGLVILFLASCDYAASAWQNHLQGTRLILGGLLSLAWLMIAGSVVYYVGTVNLVTYFFVIASLPLFAWLVWYKQRKHESDEKTSLTIGKPGLIAGTLAVGLVILLIGFFSGLQGSATIDALRSPWLVASPTLLIWIAGSAAILTLLAWKKRMRLVLAGTIATLFAGLSVALFVFPLGYGFDPFLHQATVDHISLFGTITPKPFYYIGQYALELILVLTTGSASHVIDVALLPILASILLPGIIGASMWQVTKRPQPTTLAIMASLILPLSGFINTTPQGIANLLTLSILFLSLPELVTRHRWTHPLVLVLLTIATLLVHPIAGIPAAIFVALVLTSQRVDKTTIPLHTIKRLLFPATLIVGAVILPLAFTLFGGASLNVNFGRLTSILPPVFFSTRFTVLGDLFALIGANGWIWLTLLAGIAGVIIWRLQSKRWLLYPATALLLIINALILTVVGDFSFLIDYEQTNYTDRVVTLALYMLLPLAILGLSLGVERLWQLKKTPVFVTIVLLLAAASAASVYTAYPRHDAYTISRGFTVSQFDHEAVASIHADAGDTPFVVLANQSVSAAAIQDYGFKTYYGERGDIFYYPVPTGGPMYQVFLEMIEENPTSDLAKQAMDLADVDRAYFVVNDYWWSSEVAIERAKAQTDDWFVIGDGAVWVFTFER